MPILGQHHRAATERRSFNLVVDRADDRAAAFDEQ